MCAAQDKLLIMLLCYAPCKCYKLGGGGDFYRKYISTFTYASSTLQVHPVAGASLSVVERLNTQLEDLEAKCLYCGGKMDSMISILQEEIPNIPDLAIDTENTLLLTIAGLKQVLCVWDTLCSVDNRDGKMSCIETLYLRGISLAHTECFVPSTPQSRCFCYDRSF